MNRKEKLRSQIVGQPDIQVGRQVRIQIYNQVKYRDRVEIGTKTQRVAFTAVLYDIRRRIYDAIC